MRGGLSRRDAARVEQHLQECRPCTALYLELTEVNSNLRAVLALRHRRVRAGCADPACTIVVGGFRQGLTLVLDALVAHGRFLAEKFGSAGSGGSLNVGSAPLPPMPQPDAGAADAQRLQPPSGPGAP